MAKGPETKFKEKFRPQLDALPHSWWLKTQMVALRGIPDFIGCVNGYFVAIEIKAPGAPKNTARGKLQAYICKKINDAGGIAFDHVEPSHADIILNEIRAHCYGEAVKQVALKSKPPLAKSKS